MTEIVRRINFDPAKTDSKAVGSVPIAPAVFERARLNESAKKTITPPTFMGTGDSAKTVEVDGVVQDWTSKAGEVNPAGESN